MGYASWDLEKNNIFNGVPTYHQITYQAQQKSTMGPLPSVHILLVAPPETARQGHELQKHRAVRRNELTPKRWWLNELIILVGDFKPIEKYCIVKMGIFPI